MTKTAPTLQRINTNTNLEETLLFVKSPGLIVKLVKTFYGYKVCKSGKRISTRHFGGNNSAIEAADYFLRYIND